MSAPDFSSPLRTRSRMRSTILSDVRGPKSEFGSGESARPVCSHARTHATGRSCAPDTMSASSSSSNTSSASSSCEPKAIRDLRLTRSCPAHCRVPSNTPTTRPQPPASHESCWSPGHTGRQTGGRAAALRQPVSGVYSQGRRHPTLKMRSMSACAFSLMTRPSLASRPDPPSAAAETGRREALSRQEPLAWRPGKQPGREPCAWRHAQRGANTPQAA